DLDGWKLTLLRLALTVIAAEASWRLVERPLRRPRTTGRGVEAQRYRRAELALAVAMPLILVPYLVSGRTPANPLETIASPIAGPGNEAGLADDQKQDGPPLTTPTTTPSTAPSTTPVDTALPSTTVAPVDPATS